MTIFYIFQPLKINEIPSYTISLKLSHYYYELLSSLLSIKQLQNLFTMIHFNFEC